MIQKPTLKQKWQYFFDNMMASGAPAIIGMLALASVVIILLAAGIVAFGGRLLAPEGSERLPFIEAIWLGLMRTLDAGTMGGDAGWGFRVVMFVLPTLGGVFIISSLIGVLSSAVEEKLEDLRKGRSLVLEDNHTVILGWSPQIFTIISEIVEANTNQKKPAIVVLADKDKVEMEDVLHTRVPELKNTRLICRSGSPIDPADLELVSPHQARSILVIPPEEDNPDAFVIKTVLAITNNPSRHEQPYAIATQISEPKNLRVINMLGTRDKLSTILTGNLIARITAQTSRQSGLSLVYTELLNFGGDEIYFKAEPTLVGRTYADALTAYEDSAVLGLMHSGSQAQLNPPMDTLIAPDDRLIALSADDDSIHLSGLTSIPIKEQAVHTSGPVAATHAEQAALILGWNRCASIILRELDHYVAPGSSVMVVADQAFEKELKTCSDCNIQKIGFQAGDTTDRTLLDGLKIMDYDHVIVLADSRLPVQEADARTLVTLLHLRDISSRDETHFSIVSEMLDLRNRELAEVTKVDDFIVSDHLVSLLMAQLSENSALMAVISDIFDSEGAEIYLKPIEQYVALDEAINFYTVIEAANRRGETAFGYKIHSERDDPERSFGVHTNPKKMDLITFKDGDKIIVMAEQ
jgi:voltage-gated potassium channel Kch